MKIHRTRHPLATAIRYARRIGASTVGQTGDCVIVTAANGYRRGFAAPEPEFVIVSHLFAQPQCRCTLNEKCETCR